MLDFPDEYPEEETWYEPGETIDPDDETLYESSGPQFMPDPIFVGGVSLVMGLVLFGVLLRSFDLFFAPNLDKLVQKNPPAQSLETTQSPAMNEIVADLAENQRQDAPCDVNPAFPPKVVRWCPIITFYANKHNLDPDLVAAVIWLESGGNALAYSRSGAVGLMQVMPRDGLAAAFMCVNGPCFKDRPSTEELQDPEFNISFGTRYLAGLVRRSGNLRDALRSYGPMDAGYTYSDKVLSIYNRYKGN